MKKNKQKPSVLVHLLLPGLCFGLIFISAGCGKDWLAQNPGSCVFDSDCFEGLRCIDGRCVDMELGDPDAGTRLKDFGERCEDDQECKSTYCLAHPDGAFCTKPCVEGCPSGWECKNVPDPHGPGTTIGLCAVIQNHLCQPCVNDLGCNVTGSDLCLGLDDSTYCGIDCSFSSCPDGYSCREITSRPQTAHQCIPDNGTCLCTEASAGMIRGCSRTNDLGTCSGSSECLGKDGWSECNAKEPKDEVCNGQDDDCDGFIDEQLQGDTCSESNEFGTCQGVQVCHGIEGWVCQVQQPAAEKCNLLDDDCDGATDEDFVDEQGRYVDDEHCGSCGVKCLEAISHATSTECSISDGKPVCRALQCEQGWFVYDSGLTCLALPANLCLPCATDLDCLAPGSKCVEVGKEHFCARSCAQGSPYGTSCPQGYECVSSQGDSMCMPVTGSCLCTSDTVGTVRSCMVDTCVGYQTCEALSGAFSWTECNVEDFNVEICDGIDNNCNGEIDEGFLNQATGQYDSSEHCGFCNNDCSLYWIPAIDHVDGVCHASSSAMPVCTMGTCMTETIGGVEYEWVDVNNDPDDGCECKRVAGNMETDPPDLIHFPEPGLDFVDENCDGIDGVISQSIFVRAGSTAGNGTMEAPFGTISQAIEATQSSSKKIILVAEGHYDEDIQLLAGIQIHGGYAADFISRDVVLHASVVTGQNAYATLTAEGIEHQQTPTIVSGLVIQGRDVARPAPQGEPGLSSIAVWTYNCDDSLRLFSNQIKAGRAGDGGTGRPGAPGYGREMDQALDGRAGRDGIRTTGQFPNGCPSGSSNPGGQSGLNTVCPQANGRTGGTTVCPVFHWDMNPVRGQQAQFTSEAQGDGLGGYDWSFDTISGAGCSHATESGFPSDIQLNVGHDGRDGLDGDNGQGGTGGSGSYGSVSDGMWVASPRVATSGTSGMYGHGGGGGGGGGGTAYYYSGGCEEYELGPSGGGGGAGGCGGQAGGPGRQGGASIGVILASDSNGAPGPIVEYNVIQRAKAGDGGPGGPGGQGGKGGIGGFGGAQPSWISSQGGKGGDGGNGGPGGGGGGGTGGPSFDIMLINIAPSSYTQDNLLPLPASAATGGNRGPGGISVGPGATGQPGLAGKFGPLLEISSCQGSHNCPQGQSCDANGVCVPDD